VIESDFIYDADTKSDIPWGSGLEKKNACRKWAVLMRRIKDTMSQQVLPAKRTLAPSIVLNIAALCRQYSYTSI
jgi:hypothetical protein